MYKNVLQTSQNCIFLMIHIVTIKVLRPLLLELLASCYSFQWILAELLIVRCVIVIVLNDFERFLIKVIVIHLRLRSLHMNGKRLERNGGKNGKRKERNDYSILAFTCHISLEGMK